MHILLALSDGRTDGRTGRHVLGRRRDRAPINQSRPGSCFVLFCGGLHVWKKQCSGTFKFKSSGCLKIASEPGDPLFRMFGVLRR